MVFVQVKATAYQGNLQNCLVYASSAEPFVASVGFYFSISSLGLYGTIHPEQRPMNAVQVIENLSMERSQFIVQSNNTVRLTLVAFGSVRTTTAIFALVKFHGSPILVSFYRFCSEEEKFLVIWTNQSSFLQLSFLIQRAMSLMTSPARINPAAPGTKGTEPGIWRLPVAAASSSQPVGFRASSWE